MIVLVAKSQVNASVYTDVPLIHILMGTVPCTAGPVSVLQRLREMACCRPHGWHRQSQNFIQESIRLLGVDV